MKTRVISAIIAIIIAVPFVYFGGLLYAFGIGIISLLAIKEIFDLKKSHQPIPFWPTLLGIVGYFLIIYTNFNGENFKYGSTYMHIIFTIFALLIPTLLYKKDKYTTSDALYLIGSIIFLGFAFNSFILVREEGLLTFIYLVLIPIITDTAAMITGSKIGKHKMCPTISPKKTWEGTIGGLILGTIIPCVFYLIFIPGFSWKIIMVTFILSIIGQVGDLIFSKIKRENDIKDFSNLMPGHGGALDRLDSTIAIFMTYIFISFIL